MTTPHEPPTDNQESPQVGESAPGVASPDPAAATLAAPQEPAAVPPAVQPPYPGYYPPYPPPYFAPVTKTPWINPAKRTLIIVSAVAAVLIALGAGIGIGVAIGGDGHPGHHIVIEGPRGRIDLPGQGQRKFPLTPRNGQGGAHLVPNAPPSGAPTSGAAPSSPTPGS